jgi:hypothetical protein
MVKDAHRMQKSFMLNDYSPGIVEYAIRKSEWTGMEYVWVAFESVSVVSRINRIPPSSLSPWHAWMKNSWKAIKKN